MRRLLSALSCLVMCAVTFSQEVSIRTLIPQMTDLSALSRVPTPFYTTRQASSYDRASKSPTQDWFANGDAGKFIRVEQVNGRNEKVMADLVGPGAVIRVWSANPAGTIRFYFDGEKDSRLTAKLADLLGGKVAPFLDPIAYTASMGWNFYFPLPYARSLKITVDDTDNDGSKNLYYHVGYREYEKGTQVRSFSMDQVQAMQAEIEASRDFLTNMRRSGPEAMKSDQADSAIKPGNASVLFDQPGPAAIYSLTVRVSEGLIDGPDLWTQPGKIHNILRTLILQMEFDGEKCVEVPIGDFFGSAPGLNVYRSLPMEVRETGDMVCRFVMPYSRNAKVSIRNVGEATAFVASTVRYGAYEFDRNSMLFHAQWTAEKSNTRPMHDMTFLDTKGEGTWIGCAMHVANPVPDWWGEGDEKVYIDGESFPSTFGTGTEDYYGYAWCCPTPFFHPYHAQPRVDGPGNRGHTSVNRWHILDAMPYQKSFRFDMELWHWAEVTATFARTAYWYSKLGGTSIASVNQSLLLPPEIVKPAPVVGALEAENFEIVSKSGGEVEKQAGFWQLSNGHQVWWKNGKVGDKLVLEFDAPADGMYEVSGNFCHAKDYGIQTLTINGAAAGKHDFYKASIEWKVLVLGKFQMKKGKNRLEAAIAGTNAAANPKAYMFGLDYLMLKKV